ncbi:MAG: hypothetical protein JNN26_27675 [Candidatus Obscuribacter sp.]|nr:hypothetical protein [Candidatus Obscuribacter sp.]
MFYFDLQYCQRKSSFFSRLCRNSGKANSGLNPEADEFVPTFTVLFCYYDRIDYIDVFGFFLA